MRTIPDDCASSRHENLEADIPSHHSVYELQFHAPAKAVALGARCVSSLLQEYFKDITTVSLTSVTVSAVSVTNKSTQEHFGLPDSVSDVSHFFEHKLPDRLWRRSAQHEALTRCTQRSLPIAAVRIASLYASLPPLRLRSPNSLSKVSPVRSRIKVQGAGLRRVSGRGLEG
jgi:hypothetical protein